MTWALVLTLAWGTPQMRSVVAARHLTWAQCTSMALGSLSKSPPRVAASCRREEREAHDNPESFS